MEIKINASEEVLKVSAEETSQQVSTTNAHTERTVSASSWNDLTDRPFYKADEEVTILPEATYTINADSGDAYILNPPGADVVVGNTYTVNWNGTEYSCIAQSFNMEGVDVAVLGDIGVTTGGDSTGEPFVIIMFPAYLAASVGAYGAIMALDGSASPTMSISTILETIHKLDNKYLDMAWVPTAEAEAEMVFIPAQTTSSAGQIMIRNSDIDLTMFAAGAKVAIYIDNDRYEATVIQNEQFFIAGNMSLVSGSGAPDTGEPYLIVVGGEFVQVNVSPAAEHEVAVYVFQYGQNKLPYDFLPHVVVTKGYVVETAKELRRIIPSNLVNGSAYCSVRTVNSAEEADDYNIGSDSVALGRDSRASGVGAFAFGNGVSASGRSSHAEGEASEAAGNYSHAEGEATKANGLHSHVEGLNTYAGSRCQHVQGMYNIKDDEDKYLHIVGNGKADNARSNAHTLDRDGNAWFAGKVFVGGTSMDDPEAKELGVGGGVSSWNDLTDKPFGEVTEEGCILPETTVAIADGGGAITEPYNAMPTPGKVYKVMWNGVEYNCAAIYSALMGDNYTTLGNTSVMGGEVATDDPFLIVFMTEEQSKAAGTYVVLIALDGSESVTISVFGDITTITPIPEKFLPKDFGKSAYFATFYDGTLAGGVTYESIIEAAKSGRTVYACVPAGDIIGILCGFADVIRFIDVHDNGGMGEIRARIIEVYQDGTCKDMIARIAADISVVE